MTSEGEEFRRDWKEWDGPGELFGVMVGTGRSDANKDADVRMSGYKSLGG